MWLEEFREFQNHFAKLKGMPLFALALFLEILPILGAPNYHQWAGLQSISLFYNLAVLVVLGGVSLWYMKLMYHKEWFGHKTKNRKKRYFNIISFAIIGLIAVYTPYLFGVGNLFLEVINHENDGQLSEYLLPIMLYTSVLSFIAVDMFNSLIGAAIWFKIPVDKSPVKRYSELEYKIRKSFNLTK